MIVGHTFVRSFGGHLLTHSFVRCTYFIIVHHTDEEPERYLHRYHLYETYSFRAGTTPHLMLIGQGYVFTCCVFIIDLLSSLTVEWCTQFTPDPIRGAQQLTGDEGLYLPKSKLLYL